MGDTPPSSNTGVTRGDGNPRYSPFCWLKRKNTMNCPVCNARLKRQFTPEGAEIFWCEKCRKYVEYEDEETNQKGDEDDGGGDGTDFK